MSYFFCQTVFVACCASKKKFSKTYFNSIKTVSFSCFWKVRNRHKLFFFGFAPNRLSTTGRLASALRPRCSTWCSTRAQRTCGCPRKAARLSPPPAVSALLHFSGSKTIFIYTSYLTKKKKNHQMTTRNWCDPDERKSWKQNSDLSFNTILWKLESDRHFGWLMLSDGISCMYSKIDRYENVLGFRTEK